MVDTGDDDSDAGTAPPVCGTAVRGTSSCNQCTADEFCAHVESNGEQLFMGCVGYPCGCTTCDCMRAALAEYNDADTAFPCYCERIGDDRPDAAPNYYFCSGA